MMKKLPETDSHTNPIGFFPSAASYHAQDPLNQLQITDSLCIQTAIEAIIAWTYNEHGQNIFISAYKSYHETVGKVWEEEAFYHDHTNYALNHFIFESPLIGGNLTPIQAFLQSPYFQSLKQTTQLWLSQLDQFVHSLFRIDKVKNKKLLLCNLIDKTRFWIQVEEEYLTKIYPKKSIIQGLIFYPDQGPFFSSGLLIHPEQANKLILSRIHYALSQGQSRQDLYYLFARKNLIYHRQKYLDLATIYD